MSPGVSCPPHHHQCKFFPKVCIPPEWTCDGEPDCPQGDDEEECTVSSCLPTLYQCEGTHQCLNKLWVCDGDVDCSMGDDERGCEGPQAVSSCSQTPTPAGYVKGRSLECTCHLDTPPGHAGMIEWDVVKGPREARIKGGSITLQYNTLYDELHYACRGYLVSKYRGNYTDIRAKFAFFDENSVVLRPSVLTFCEPNDDEKWEKSTLISSSSATTTSTTTNNSNNNNITTSSTKNATSTTETDDYFTCQVSKLSVHPAPTFSFSLNGAEFDSPVVGEDTGTHYIRRFRFGSKAAGGQHFVKCLVSNPIFSDLQQEVHKPVWIKAPPPQAPTLTALGQNFQGVHNEAVTLTVSDLDTVDPGDVTCAVRGGYPAASVVHVWCEWLSRGTSGTVRHRSGTVPSPQTSNLACTCIADHESGCYSNHKTTVMFAVKVQAPQTTSSSTENSTTTTEKTKTTKPSSFFNENKETSNGNPNSKDNSHSTLLYVFIIISIIAVIIIVILVIIIVAIIQRRKKNYNVGDNNKIMFSDRSSTNGSHY